MADEKPGLHRVVSVRVVKVKEVEIEFEFRRP